MINIIEFKIISMEKYRNYLSKCLYILILLLLYSCTTKTNSKEKSKSNENIFINLQGDSLSIQSQSSKYYSLSLSLIDNDLTSKQFSQLWSDNILEIIKEKFPQKQELALYATKNNNELPIRLYIPNLIDTIVIYQIESYIPKQYIGSIQGTCSPIKSKNLDENNIVETKRWLFRNKEPLTDSLVQNMVNILNILTRTNYDEYVTTTEIPVVKTFSNNKYKISSDLKADYYVLYACSSQKELNDFVEKVVASDFKLAKSSPNMISECNYNENISGYNSILLIGINKDWSYKIHPLGVISIDNIAPSYSGFNTTLEPEYLLLDGNTKINLPNDIPNISGYTRLHTKDFGGNGVSCQVNFSLSFGGDVKSLTIDRNGILSKWLRTEKKHINLQSESSPYLFTYELHLEDGDNYVPIIVTDIRGNEVEYKLNIPASFTRHNPDVEINNNIDIDNY